MAIDLVPSSFFPYPSFRIPSIWNEDDDFINSPVNSSGLSISEDENNIYVDASVPGIDPKNVEITFHDGNLWIKGEIREEEKDKSRKYYREATRSFSYRVVVPGEIDQNQDPTATYKHGIMKVAFKKSPKSQPKKIQVNVEPEK